MKNLARRGNKLALVLFVLSSVATAEIACAREIREAVTRNASPAQPAPQESLAPPSSSNLTENNIEKNIAEDVSMRVKSVVQGTGGIPDLMPCKGVLIDKCDPGVYCESGAFVMVPGPNETPRYYQCQVNASGYCLYSSIQCFIAP